MAKETVLESGAAADGRINNDENAGPPVRTTYYVVHDIVEDGKQIRGAWLAGPFDHADQARALKPSSPLDAYLMEVHTILR